MRMTVILFQVDLIVPTNVQGLTIYDVEKVVKSMQNGCGATREVIKYTNIFVSFAEELSVFQPYKETVSFLRHRYFEACVIVQ